MVYRPRRLPGRIEARQSQTVFGWESAGKPGSVEDSHSSGRCVTAGLKQPTREPCGPHVRSPIWSCSRWGLPCHACYQSRGALLPHHFTLTRAACMQAARAVYFLWHLPWARALQVLPGTLPCGARTFLPACAERLSGRLLSASIALPRSRDMAKSAGSRCHHFDQGLRAPRNSLPSRRLSLLSRRSPGIRLVFPRRPSSRLNRCRPQCSGSIISPRRNAVQALSR
jgi:hypothetical protein